MSARPTNEGEALALFRQVMAELALPKENLVLLAGGQAGALVPPPRVQVMREGSWVTHPSGPFQTDVDYFNALISNFRKYKTQPVLDVEHSSVLPWDTAPAQGYAEDLLVDADRQDPARKGLFAETSWSDVGADNVKNGRYRFLSAGVIKKAKDRQSGDDIGPRLDHIALVKKPFIEGMDALFSFHFPGLGRADGKEFRMNEELLKKLRVLLKVAADANESVILAKAGELEQVILAGIERRPAAFLSAEALGVLQLVPTANADEVSRKIVLLSVSTDVTSKRLATLERQSIESIVDKAIGEKKLTPAERVPQIELALKDRTTFDSLLALRQPIVTDASIVPRVKPRLEGGDPTALFQAQSKVIDEYLAKNPGVTERDAILACSKSNPELFPSHEEVTHG